MSDPAVETQTLDDELHALAAPIRERLKRLEAELQQAQEIVERLKADRVKIRRALAAVDPTFEQVAKPRAKAKDDLPAKTQYSEAAVERAAETLEQLRDQLDGTGFYASELSRREGWPFSTSYTPVLLAVLHDRGVVRLVRKGKGGGKIYALV